MVEEGKTKISLKPLAITLLFLLLTLSVTVLFFRGMKATTLISSNILVLTLVNINIILVTLLVLLLSRNLIKIYFERRQGRLGSRFRAKLIAAFVGLALIPSILLFIVASGLITSSIENWFSIQVERSLDNALYVARTVYQEAEEKALVAGRHIGDLLEGDPGATEGLKNRSSRSRAWESIGSLLEQKREEGRFSAIGLYTAKLEEVGKKMDPSISEPHYVYPSEDLFEKASSGEAFTVIRTTAEGDLVRAIIPVMSTGSAKRAAAYLVVDSLIPSALVGKMEEINKAFEDYKQLQAFKNPIKGSYILSFFIIVLLIIFSATWFGFFIARGITVPIQRLAEGTEAVANGNLDFRIKAKASDEIRTLIDSFNKMTGDLKQGKDSLMATNRELEMRRAYMERVLQTIATGVISIDRRGEITTFNPSAEQILGVSGKEALRRDYAEFFILKNLAPLSRLIEQMQAHPKEALEEEVQVETEGGMVTLQITLTPLADEGAGPPGVVMVFDDLSELIRTQKVAAWQEVARRIAHEIKNPLTPIQLSAQRLRKRLFEASSEQGLSAENQKIVDEATGIIIAEVNSLKALVDEFSNFARMPTPRPSPQNVNAILAEVAALYQGAHKDLEIIAKYEENPPLIQADRDQIKRVFVNLFENALEAMNYKGWIWVSTSHDAAQKSFRVEISDEGVGIPPEDMERLFLPYFSKKKSGTGLGLAIVKRIVSDHNGQIRVKPHHPKGTTFMVELPA